MKDDGIYVEPVPKRITITNRLQQAFLALVGERDAVVDWLFSQLNLETADRMAANSALAKARAEITSLTASLDDAHSEVSRLCGEKHARDTVIHEAIGVLERLHRQEAGK